MSAPNPWTVVQAADYERHMGPEGLDLAAPLSTIFQEAYLATQPDRVLVVGCATGNGLEHVNPAVTSRVVGVDVNLQYLGIARQRFFQLGPRLELYCADVATWKAPPGSFDLVHVALVFEYLYPEVLVRKIAEWLADGGTCSVVLQAGGGGPEAPGKALKIIEKAAKPVSPDELTRLFEHYQLPLRRQQTVSSTSGRAVWAATFGKAARPK